MKENNKTKKLVSRKCLLMSNAVLCSALLMGCEAPLNLDGVDQELAKQVRRTDQLQGVAANDKTMVAVGSDGLVLTSAVDAFEWTRQVLSGAPSMVDIAVCPNQSFVALSMDKRVWFSDDNAKNWQSSQLPTQEDVIALTCAPDNSVWVVGSFSTVLSSFDQGVQWQSASLEEDAMLTDIQFIDDAHAIATGEFGLVARSEDGGQSWFVGDYIPNDFYSQSAFFTSVDVGWVAGLNGQILNTVDGGATWTKQATATESPLYGFYQANNRLFAYGDHATVLSFDGARWQHIPNPNIPVYLRGAVQTTQGELLLAGGFGSLYTLDIRSSGHAQVKQ